MPVVVISTNVQIGLVPNLVVIERVREPQGVLVVYRSNRTSTVFVHHDRDLRSRTCLNSCQTTFSSQHKSG